MNGVARAKEEGTLQYINGQEKIAVDVELKVLEKDELEKAIKKLENL